MPVQFSIMKAVKLFISLVIIVLFCDISSQGQTITIKFTALLNGAHVHLDSVRITNLNHPGDTVLYWPDTLLSLGYLGMEDHLNINNSAFQIGLSSNNTSSESAIILLDVPSNGNVQLMVTDVSGSVIQEISQQFSKGTHLIRYNSSVPGINIVSARFESEVRSLKLISTVQKYSGNALDYIGLQGYMPPSKSSASTQSFLYYTGDSLSFKGWYNGQNMSFIASPMANSVYTFLFGLNYPCPGMPGFVYEGQNYNTVQIGSQCWMRENLNVGLQVNSNYIPTVYHSDMHDDGKIEKYCYNNDSANCLIYGGLYEWDEMMKYGNTPGIQGICAIGWHIPTAAELCTLAS